MCQGKLETKGFVMESGDIIENMQEKEMYKYLDRLQALQIKHKAVKQ